jgi:hypothetical protein
MQHRALQLILPFEPALPDRPLILAQRLWPMMTPRARQQLAKRAAYLLRSALIAADARKLSGGLSMNMLLNLESPVTTAHRAKLAYIYVRQSTAGQVRQQEHGAAVPAQLIEQLRLVGPRSGLKSLMTTLGSLVRQAAAAAAFGG